MEWKALLLQSFLTLVAVLVGVMFFSPDNTHQIKALFTVQESILKQIQNLDIQKSDRWPGGLQQTSSSFAGSGRPDLTDIKEINQNLHAINQSLQEIMESLTRLEDSKGASYPFLPQIPAEVSADKIRSERKLNSRKSAIDVIEDFPEHTRMQVDEIFRKHAESFSTRFSAALVSDPQALQEMMEKSDQELKEKLRSVLDEEEFDKLMKSMPKGPNFGKPPAPRRGLAVEQQ